MKYTINVTNMARCFLPDGFFVWKILNIIKMAHIFTVVCEILIKFAELKVRNTEGC